MNSRMHLLFCRVIREHRLSTSVKVYTDHSKERMYIKYILQNPLAYPSRLTCFREGSNTLRGEERMVVRV